MAHLAVAVVHGRYLDNTGQVPAGLHRDSGLRHLDPQNIRLHGIQPQPVVDRMVVPGLQVDDQIDLLLVLDSSHTE